MAKISPTFSIAKRKEKKWLCSRNLSPNMFCCQEIKSFYGATAILAFLRAHTHFQKASPLFFSSEKGKIAKCALLGLRLLHFRDRICALSLGEYGRISRYGLCFHSYIVLLWRWITLRKHLSTIPAAGVKVTTTKNI